MVAPHSSKLQHHWNLTVRFFSVISRTIVVGGGLTLLQRCRLCILKPQTTGQKGFGDPFVFQKPRELYALHFLVCFRFVHVLFISMVIFHFLAQFSVDHGPLVVPPNHLHFLCNFAAFVYYVIDRFVSISAYPTLAILLHITNFNCDITGPYRF